MFWSGPTIKIKNVSLSEGKYTACVSLTYLRLEYVITIIILILFFGRFPAELGPETFLNESGAENGAEITQNYPRRPILRPFRDHFLVRTHN